MEQDDPGTTLTDPHPDPVSQRGYGTIPQMFSRSVAAYADEPALSHKEDGAFVTTTYGDLERRSAALALALVHVLDIQKGELVALVSNNRSEWMLCSLAIHSVGAVDVPRASDTPSEILTAILSHAEPAVAILENQAQLEKVREALPALRAAVLIDAPADVPTAPDGRARFTLSLSFSRRATSYSPSAPRRLGSVARWWLPRISPRSSIPREPPALPRESRSRMPITC